MVRMALAAIVGWLATLGIVVTAPQKAAQPLPPAQRLIVIVCDGLTLRDVERMGDPATTLLRRGAVGLLSGSSLELHGRRSVYVTLGSGVRRRAADRAALGRWLMQHRKTMCIVGDNMVAALLGATAPRCRQTNAADITFIATSPQTLPATLRHWIAHLRATDCLWLIVPNSPQVGWTTRRLTPIVLFGASVPRGWLTSPTTRTVGLVSSVDFAPTVLTQLRLPIPAEVTGAPMHLVRAPDPLPHLRWLDERSQLPLRQLPTVAVISVVAVAAALALTALALLHPLPCWRRWQCAVVIAGMSIPVLLFVCGQLPFSGTPFALLLFCVLGVVAVISAFGLPTDLPAYRIAGVVCGVSALIGLLGVPLYWATPLGHYPTTGWRYFGITNAGIGIVLAGTVFAWGALRLPHRWMVVWCAIAPLLMGSSLWGANFGGAMTLAVGFAAAWELLVTERPAWQRGVARSLLALLATVGTLTLTESWLPVDERAHYGQLLLRLQSVGVGALTEMVTRKLALLWRFTTALSLNWALLAIFAAFTVSVPLLLRRSAALAPLRSAFIATFIGAWCGFCLNDSGIEVIGMALVYVGGMFLITLPHCRPLGRR